MNAFLNPIQFNRAAAAAGVDRAKARDLYSEALLALAALTPTDVQSRGMPRPLTPRPLPATARGTLRETIEKQNAQRARAMELQLVPNVFVSICADVVADIRIINQGPAL